jgi:uncharacterized FlaG/YvyC family protein
MSENMIAPISNIRSTDAGITPKATSAVPVEAERAQKPASTEQEKGSIRSEKEPSLTNEMSNISLQFHVDDETQELTVFVVDRQSKRVLRSIPPGELYKLEAGDLLKLIA